MVNYADIIGISEEIWDALGEEVQSKFIQLIDKLQGYENADNA